MFENMKYFPHFTDSSGMSLLREYVIWTAYIVLMDRLDGYTFLCIVLPYDVGNLRDMCVAIVKK